LFSFVPFPVFEILLYAATAGALAALVYITVRLIMRPGRLRFLARSAANTMLIALAILFAFLLFWGMNYFANPPTLAMGLAPGEHTVEELHEATRWILENANALSLRVPRDSEGVSDFGGFEALRHQAGTGFAVLARHWPDLFDPNPPPPKQVIARTTLRRFSIVGVYAPWTGESNVGRVLDSEMPFVMAHELAHRMAFTNEAETNFIAFLACVVSPHPEVAYSGWLMALSLCLNKLAEENQDLWGGVWADMAPGVRADFRALHAYAQQFVRPPDGRGPDLQAVGRAINDTYLQAMAVQEGVKSYGLAVDLILAYRKSGINLV
jgi:hypothetical protein